MTTSDEAVPVAPVASQTLPRAAHFATEQRATRRAWAGRHATLLAFVAYAAVTAAAFWPVWPGDPHAMSSCACGDQAQQVWFLAWTPYAVLHGHNPFFTTFLDYPRGVNLGANTLMPLLGLLGAPLTLTAGPIATFNLWLWLAFPLSATACFVLLRRWVRWAPAAFVGGLLYGFSPYMVGQGAGHLDLLFVPLPPLLVLLLDELLVHPSRAPVVVGALLGLTAAAQYFVAAEVLGGTALLAAVGLGVVAIARPRLVLGRLRRAGPGLVAGAAIFGALVGYPLWMQVAGPRHLVGSAHGSYPFAADLLGPVVPTAHQLLAPSSLVAVSSHFILGDVTENGSYLGIPLLVVLVAIVAWRWRRPLVRFTALMGLVAEVLSLGPTLTVDSHPTGIPLPMKALDHLPLITSFVDARFSLYVDLCVAVLLALGADELWAVAVTPRRRRRAAHRRGRRPAAGPAVVLAAALATAFVPLLPAWPYPAFAADIPSFFATAAVDRLPPGTVVMTYPYASVWTDLGMLWQAKGGMRFRLVGGYALVPGVNGAATYTDVPEHEPSVVATLVADRTALPPALAIPGTTMATSQELLDYLRRQHVSVVVAERGAPGSAKAIQLLEGALGKPSQVGTVDTWKVGAPSP